MKRVLVVLLVLILIPVVIWGYSALNSPGKPLSEAQKLEALTNILGRKPNFYDTTPKGNKTYNGKYANFSYPAAAVIYNYRDPNISKDPNVLEIFSFDIQNPRLIFNYSVSQNKNVTQISDIPDVKLRQIQSNLYNRDYAYIGDTEGLVFQKQDENGKTEKTAFFFVNGKAYSFSIQGADLKAVENLYNLILSSTKFL